MSKLSTKLAEIDKKWLHYLEKHGVKSKTHWWQNSLDCSKPQFLPHAKKFWAKMKSNVLKLITSMLNEIYFTICQFHIQVFANAIIVIENK